MRTGNLYFSAVGGDPSNQTAYTISGEFREPKKGEFFLSGAVVEVYKAVYDLSTKYWIAIPVKVAVCPTCNGKGKVIV